MRDHRAISSRLRARWMRAHRPMRGVDRVCVTPPAPRFTSVRHVHSHTHIAFASALNHTHIAFASALNHTNVAFLTALHAHRTLHTTVHAPVAGPTFADIEHTTGGRGSRPPAPDRRAGLLVGPPPIVTTVHRVVATELRERTIVPARQETRVSRVACVVPKAAATRGRPTDEVERPVTARPAPAAWAPQPMTTPPLAATPTQLATITDHVLTAIDRRLIAHNERLGRG